MRPRYRHGHALRARILAHRPANGGTCGQPHRDGPAVHAGLGSRPLHGGHDVNTAAAQPPEERLLPLRILASGACGA